MNMMSVGEDFYYMARKQAAMIFRYDCSCPRGLLVLAWWLAPSVTLGPVSSKFFPRFRCHDASILAGTTFIWGHRSTTLHHAAEFKR